MAFININADLSRIAKALERIVTVYEKQAPVDITIVKSPGEIFSGTTEEEKWEKEQESEKDGMEQQDYNLDLL